MVRAGYQERARDASAAGQDFVLADRLASGVARLKRENIVHQSLPGNLHATVLSGQGAVRGMSSWTCRISDPGGPPVLDVKLESSSEVKNLIPDGPFTYLATVDIARVPLILRWGPVLTVTTTSEHTAAWFSQALSYQPDVAGDEDHDYELPFGILVSASNKPSDVPQTTEILFFAVRSESQPPIFTAPTDRTYSIAALCLSSHLIPHLKSQITPSRSPNHFTFLNVPRPGTTIVPTTKKRKTALQAFDLAADRLKRRKRAPEAEAETVEADDKRNDDKPDQSVPGLLKRERSRTSSRPSTPLSVALAPGPAQTDGHARPRSQTDAVEERNRETISRLVMAGMRMHGVGRDRGEEYKLIYHNTLRAVVFSFRRQMADVALQGRVGPLRERVDTLLDMFCDDPLATTPTGHLLARE